MNTVTEKGFSLVVALIFMAVLAIIGISVAGNTTSEEKMARNFRDRDIAFAAAEATLRDAELRINGKWCWPNVVDPLPAHQFDDACTGGLCDSRVVQAGGRPVDLTDFFAADASGSTAVIGTTTGSPPVQGLSAADQPRYRIEVVRANPAPGKDLSTLTEADKTAYRITVQARGRLPSTRVALQEVYRPPN